MQIVFDDGAGHHELDLRVNNPSATVADLAAALDPRSDQRDLLIGDRPTDPDLDLREAGLHEGVVVRFAPGDDDTPVGAVLRGANPAAAAAATRRPAAGWPDVATVDGPLRGRDLPGTARPLELAVVNGLDAGRRFPLVAGTAVIGRGSSCDVVLHHATVSKRHATLTLSPTGEVTVTDLDSHNGTWVGDDPVDEPTVVPQGTPLRLGALELAVRTVDDRDQPVAVDPLRYTTAAGTLPFNRPPRTASAPPPPPVTAPQPARSGSARSPLSVIGILAPLVFAGVMFAVMQSPQFLMFGLLSPVMAIGNAIDGKRRGRKSDRSERERYRRELEDFRHALDRLADEEGQRRHATHPDPAEIMRRVTLPSTTLWERRPGHADFLHLRAGVGDVPWEPPVTEPPGAGPPPEETVAALHQAARLPSSAVPLDLSGGRVVGVVGDRDAALALVRSLVCQAAALHGPADLPVMVLADSQGGPAWDWAKWLPHTREPSGVGRRLSHHPELSNRMAEGQLKAGGAPGSPAARPGRGAERPPVRGTGMPAPAGLGAGAPTPAGPTLLVVVDDESLTAGRKAPTRNLLRGEGGPVAGIVIAATVDRLPAVCTSVVRLDGPDGQASLVLPQRGERVDDFLACGLSDDVARDCARSLALYEDPELDLVGAGLPPSIRLLPLLELEESTPEAVLARWKSGGDPNAMATPVGVSEAGAFSVDLVADGPHGLVGGTTGAGKSELLRTIVAGLAASFDPDHLTFVLIDFKGGSAFDECARLPHTVGLVTDLDEHLAERALRCLEAELKHRERLLRDAGAIDLPDYLRSRDGREPLPRLLVIIDEFATLKAELPDFIDALVGVAQRGRSLGVHLLLATQRPQGAISENIKANTNLRIALRVQDRSDSTDIIEVPDAAAIARNAPGRAYVRLGPGEVVAIQTALATGDRNEAALVSVDLAPFVYGPTPRPPIAPSPSAPGAGATSASGPEVRPETDLTVLVNAIRDAFARTGRPIPRRPWPDPLPAEVDLDTLIDDARATAGTEDLGYVPLALADDPDRQRQHPIGWRPAEGNLLVYGVVGGGTTTLLSSLALSLARLHPPDRLHLYVLDFGAGELAPLADLPHCGGVVLANERERQQRVIRMLRAELVRRRELPRPARAGLPTIVALLDTWSAFVAEHQDVAGQDLVESLVRVFADGPDVGLHLVISGDRSGGISHLIASTARQRWALRLADRADYAVAGVSARAVPEMLPGHAIVSETKQLVHVARPRDGVAAAVARIRVAHEPVGPDKAPQSIRSLPDVVRLSELATPAQLSARPWTLPIGVAEHDLGPAELISYAGEHAMVLGPARSGKSTTLLTVASAVLAAAPEAVVAALAHARSPLAGDHRVRHVVDPSSIEELPAITRQEGAPVLVLIDDAETIDDQRLEALVTSRKDNLLVVAAGRADLLRSNYNHWTRPLRRSKLGVLLKPELDLDGDLLGTRLPRRPPVAMTRGRGFVVTNADPVLAQIALPE